jgi:hypothetical protein
MLLALGIALNAVAGALFAVPVVGYIFGPAKAKGDEEGTGVDYDSARSRNSLKARPGWQPIATRSCAPGMATPATFLAGCGEFPPTSCRFSLSIARILAVQCGGMRSQDCFCAHVMAAHITRMAVAPRPAAARSLRVRLQN